MKIRITHQGELVKITPRVKRAIFPHKFGRGDRDVTTQFSDRSRKNLLEKFATIDKQKAKNATFITLTYVENMVDHEKANRDIDVFMKRLIRENEDCFGVWKKEPQKRGAIHFHMMIWNLPFIHRERVAYDWAQVTGSWDVVMGSDGEEEYIPPFTRIEYCKQVRKCWYYLSKYIAKSNNDTIINEETGEISKKQSDENFLSAPADSSRFNYGTNPTAPAELGICDTTPYLPEGEQQKPKSTGRWWGWFNRSKIPYAQNVTTEIECTWAEYRRFRWDLRRVMGHTSQIHDSHTVKMFWFEKTLDPITMLIRGKIGEKVFEKADKWVNDYERGLWVPSTD